MIEGTNTPASTPNQWKAKVGQGLRSARNAALQVVNVPLERVASYLERKVNDHILSSIHRDYPDFLDAETVQAIKELDPHLANGLLTKAYDDIYNFEPYFSPGSARFYVNTLHLRQVIDLANQARIPAQAHTATH